MGKYSSKEWYLKEVKKYMDQYGEIPPHWIIFPNTHPYSIMWRMGAGETFVMTFSNWMEDNISEREKRIQFFHKYPAPPRWLEVMASYIWDFDLIEDFEQSVYPKKLKALGFEGIDEYLEDLEDEKWLD